jgi:hypothetical protein
MGPARLTTLSPSPYRRNVMLGQEGRSLHFRVRNDLTGDNGAKYPLVCARAFSDRPVHVVATYDHGVSTLYRDGERVCGPLDLREPGVMLRVGTGRASAIATALLAALTLLATGVGQTLTRLFVVGYAALLLPFAIGTLLPSFPATGVLIWFGPALAASWLTVNSRHVKWR